MNLYQCVTVKRDDVSGPIGFGVVRANDEKEAARLFMIGLREDRLEEDVTYIYIRVHRVYEGEPNVAASLKIEMAQALTFHREQL